MRNAEGATELLNRMIAPDNSDDLRVECMKALEVLGTLESCRHGTLHRVRRLCETTSTKELEAVVS